MAQGPIWHDDGCQRHAALRGDVRADVVFVGGGLTALAAAWLLGKHGVRVTVLEARTVGSGTSGMGLGVLSALDGLRYEGLLRRLGLQRAGAIARAHTRAVSLLTGIVAEEEIACELAAQDAFCYGDASQVDVLQREQRSLEQLGVAAQIVEGGPEPLRHAQALRLGGQATLHPARLLCALAAAVACQGGRVYENSPVLRTLGGVAQTEHGSVRAHNVVVTARPLLRGERLSIATLRLAALKGAPLPQGIWVPVVGGPALRARGDLMLAAMAVPRDDGGEALRQRAAINWPTAAVVRQWDCAQAAGSDGLPLIGVADPARPTDLLAVGSTSMGLAQEVVAAQLLCDIVLDRPNELAALFAPTRRDIAATRTALRRAGVAVEAAMAFATKKFERK